jgi:hypothetical protein
MFNQKTPGTFNFPAAFLKVGVSNAHSLWLWLAGWRNRHSCDHWLWWNLKVHLLAHPLPTYTLTLELDSALSREASHYHGIWTPPWYWIKLFLSLNSSKLSLFLVILPFSHLIPFHDGPTISVHLHLPYCVLWQPCVLRIFHDLWGQHPALPAGFSDECLAGE